MARKPLRTEWRFRNGKWTRSLGNRGARIRLFQKRRDGVFYRAIWLSGGGIDRKSLGTRDRAEAEKLGTALLSALLRDEDVGSSAALSLGMLWRKYKTESDDFLDNTPSSKRDAEGHAQVLLGFFGDDCEVRSLTGADQRAFTQKRLAGGIECGIDRVTVPVRARSVQMDIQLLHTMLKWALTVRVNGGRRLLDHHPLAGVKRLREVNPKRPVATAERFEKTRKAAQLLAENAVTDAGRAKWIKLELALVLAEATGRRLGSIRQLRWDDVDFKQGTIRWRAATDKKGKEWKIPMPPSLKQELVSFRRKMGSAFGQLVFPSHDRPDVPLRTDQLSQWLITAEKKAKLPKLDGSLWHAYRRGWATERKHYPVADVAAAGGWRDIGTLIRCYQLPDDATLLRVMSHSRKAEVATSEAPVEGETSPQTDPARIAKKNPDSANRYRGES